MELKLLLKCGTCKFMIINSVVSVKDAELLSYLQIFWVVLYIFLNLLLIERQEDLKVHILGLAKL